MLVAREMTSPGQEVQHTIAIFVELNFQTSDSQSNFPISRF